MHWNEKIDLIKKWYSPKEFSIPHVDRKEILRKIETKFIGRSAEYYDLNNFNERFSNWWDNIKSESEETFLDKKDWLNKLRKQIHLQEPFWIAGEFRSGVMIYKTSKEASLDLILIGSNWADTFHLIHLKYESIISFKIEDECIRVKKIK